MKAKDPKIVAIFKMHPAVSELYIDTAGNVWTNKTTADLQSRGGQVKILKRTDFLTAKAEK